MSGPQDSDVCASCGLKWWEHEVEGLARDGRPRPRRCPPARFRLLAQENTMPNAELVQDAINSAQKQARGLEVLRDALLTWERHLQDQLAVDGRPKGQMEELIQQDREALNDLLQRLL